MRSSRSSITQIPSMPIIVPPSLRILSDTVYRDLNRQVLGLIFKVQNDYGRVCDESVFKGVIASRWSKTGKVEREVPIVLNHQWYSKTYFFDLLFEDGLMVEAKAVERLVGRHRAQSLSYLLMADLRHGILVNLRSPRVEHEFVSTQLSPEARRKIDVRLGPGERCAPTQLVHAAESLLRD